MIADHAYEVSAGQVFLRLPWLATAFDPYLKLEGLNPAGSIKLKAAREIIETAEAQGLLGPGASIIESTSGNLGIALATLCAAKGYRITLVTDPNANPRGLAHMRALGATVVVIDRRDRDGGYLQARIDHILGELAADPTLVWLNQYANPANVAAHRRHTAREIVEGFGVPDWLFVGVGTSGTLMGCVDHFRDTATTIVAVDSVGSVTFGAPPAPRFVPGIGTSRRPELVRDENAFRLVYVSELDAIRLCRRLARERGLLLGGSSGSVLAAMLALGEQIPAGARVLGLSPDLGDRYLDTIYDNDWVTERFGRDALTVRGRNTACSSTR
ncbi:2,3-diaminopropionate biosynthesis protein SbnA [Actinophytocola xinjiangensis]|uniref:2,3-diaminopropionate biosynthesis protein SbnA n=1 Tax=Actinophytocola xinjiangensis TaxID=485602 RepID=UPI000A029ACF|nr:2,3-diaminopropionate biosynthesis protein SbnA [Actinophytocola xinjiangensis]